jgi:phosphohistidine swiveling domain-containing protein
MALSPENKSAPDLSAHVVSLLSAAREDCGEKAANLARLHGLGCRIPDGVVLTKFWLARHLAACARGGVSLAFDGGSAEEWTASARESREAILTSPLEPSLRAVLADIVSRWPGRRFAVRSSALGEDSREHSFAGQLDTVLEVAGADALEEAVRRVWASLWSERSLAYQRRRGVRLEALGVIVCEQIDARFSGVLFTRAPAGCAPASMLVEYCEGLGDGLVGGRVSPGFVSLARSDGRVLSSGAAPNSRAPLENLLARVGYLAKRALELEGKFGEPLDIEWAIDAAGTIWFLQARTITTTASAPATVWSDANIAENFPDVVSPMLYSIARRGYAAYFRNLGLGFGISRRRIEAMRDSLENIVGQRGGRLYYNLSNIHALLHLAPGGAWLARFFNEFTGAHDFPSPPPRPSLSWPGRVLEVVRVPLAIVRQYARVCSRIGRFEATVDEFCRRYPPEALAGLPRETLRGAIRDFLDIRLNRWNDAALADTAAMVCYGLLGLAVRRAFSGEQESSLHNTLLKGLPDLASNTPVARLWDLSRQVRGDEQLRALLRSLPASEFAAALVQPELQGFASAFRDYLERWGFRSSRELMLTVPTPPERPEDAVALLKLYTELEGPSPQSLLEQQAAERIALTQRLLRRFSRLRSLGFRTLLSATQGAICLRERARFRQALLYTRLRRILLATGDHLVSSGALASRDDVFFLEVDELDALLAGSTTVEAAKASITARRILHERFTRAHLAEACPASADRGTSVLRGTGACGGAYRGTAAVLEDAQQASDLSPGKLLVTRQTDPGWAAVFFVVRGLVVERGGMLSHGAIIAREYGIPAVVGVPNAMELIRNGDDVEVNGDRGTVEIFRA